MIGNPGAARLARAQIALIRDHAPRPAVWLELAYIQPDSSLLVDGFPDPWPIGSYLVLEQALSTIAVLGVAPPPLTTDAASGHAHLIQPFGEYLPLAPGDRVLVALIQDETVAVVLGRTRPARLST